MLDKYYIANYINQNKLKHFNILNAPTVVCQSILLDKNTPTIIKGMMIKKGRKLMLHQVCDAMIKQCKP